MILYWVSRIIYYQFLTVMFLTGLTLLLLLYRKRVSVKRKRIRDDYGDFLAMELSQVADAPGVQPVLNPYLKYDLNIVQEVLLEKIKLITGAERDYLVSLYVLNGFKAKDISQCKSIFWWKRLNAVTHLGSLTQSELAPKFFEMMKDTTPLVAVAAALSLSLLNHPLNGPDLIVQLPRGMGQRYNALCEIVTNVGIRHGIGPLIWSIHHHTHPKVPTACIRALRYIRTIEAGEALNEILKEPSKLSEDSLVEIMQTISAIGAPSSLESARPFLKHTNPYIRAEAAIFLITLGDADTIGKINELRNDPSVEMKRVIQIFAASASEAAS